MVILGLNPRKVYERQNPNFAILMHSKGNRELLNAMPYLEVPGIKSKKTVLSNFGVNTCKTMNK